MKNICILNSLPFFGGGEKLHLELTKELRNRGFKVIFFAMKNSHIWEKLKSLSIKVYPIVVGKRSFLNPIKVNNVYQVLRKEHIDTLIFSMSQDCKLGSISAKLAKVERIVYLRGISLPIKARFVNKLIFNKIITHIILNSEATKKSVLKYLDKFINHNKIKVIHHGVEDKWLDDSNLKKLEIIKRKGQGILLGNAARLSSEKKQTFLIDIAKRLKKKKIDFTIFIAGIGQQIDEIKTLIIQNKLQNDVIMLGFVKDMEAFMNSIDIFLMTSYREGFGFVMIEAMAKKVPVIAFNRSAMKEVVKHSKTGFLIDYPDIEDFTNKTKKLIENTNLREKMGEEAKKDVLNRFLMKDKVSEIVAYLQDS